MAKAAIVILAGMDSHADNGRVLNGLEAARSSPRRTGTKSSSSSTARGPNGFRSREDEDHDYHDVYAAVEDEASACEFCAGAFGVDDAIQDTGVVQVDENDGHPSIRSLVDDDYEIITF